MSDLTHGMNCAALTPGHDDECTCGLAWRIKLRDLEALFPMEAYLLIWDIHERWKQGDAPIHPSTMFDEGVTYREIVARYIAKANAESDKVNQKGDLS